MSEWVFTALILRRVLLSLLSPSSPAQLLSLAVSLSSDASRGGPHNSLNKVRKGVFHTLHGLEHLEK